MRRLMPSLVAVALFAGCASLPKPQPTGVTVDQVLEAIDEAATVAYAEFGDRFNLTLTKVKVNLSTTSTKSHSGGLNVVVLSFGSSKELTAGQSVTVVLAPPDPKPPGAPLAFDLTDQPLVQSLVEGFRAAMAAARGAKNGLQAAHPEGIPLEATDVVVSISFGLTKSSKGGFSIELGDIGISGEGARSIVGKQSIELSFKIKTGT